MAWVSHGREFDTEREAVEHSVFCKLYAMLGVRTVIDRRHEVIEWLLDIDRADCRDKARAAVAGMKEV